MAKMNDAGVYQDANGFWFYRIKLTSDALGNKIDIKKKTDENGQPFKTKTACIRARSKRLVELQEVGMEKKETWPATLEDIWNIFLEKDSKKKAKATIVKYTSVWNNHIKDGYGKSKLKNLDVSDLEVILVNGIDNGLAYAYVESFLKLFYLLFGIAYREQMIDPVKYTRMFIDRGTRLRMPPKRIEDEDEGNRVFYKYELKEIFEIVNGTNLQTAFMFGYYCGLRVAEVFGLRWSDIDWNAGTIVIRSQMNFEDGCHCLGPVKTLAGNRKVELPTVLMEHLVKQYRHYKQNEDSPAYRNTECVLDKRRIKQGVELIGGDFINRKENGELLTPNSVKFYAKKIKAETTVTDFKFHSLRKTHLTELAAMGTPAHVLMKHAGHKKITTTMKYYLGDDDISMKKLVANVNKLGTEEPDIETTDMAGNSKLIKESDYIQMLKAKSMVPCVKEKPIPYIVKDLRCVV